MLGIEFELKFSAALLIATCLVQKIVEYVYWLNSSSSLIHKFELQINSITNIG